MIKLNFPIALLTALLLAMSGIFKVSTPWLENSVIPTDTLQTAHPLIKNEGILFSQKFYQLEYEILNKWISKERLEEEINNLPEDFEKDYLLALIKKRENEFNIAYDLLIDHLSSSPPLFRYYDELVELANITGNLDNISEALKKEQTSENNYYKYLAGILEFTKGNYTECIKDLQTLVDAKITSVEIYHKLTSAYRGIGDYDQGLKEITKAESLADSNSFDLPKILNAKGSIYFLSGLYDQANEYYKKANLVAKKTGNVVEEIRSLANLAIIDDIYGDVEKARKKFIVGTRMADKIENHELIAFLNSELGVSYTYTNNIVEARNRYMISYKFYSLLNNRERLSYLSSNIASIYLQQANYKSALKYYKEGLNFAAENKLGQILSITGIADVYSNESNYARALEYYRRAMQIADSIKDVSSIIKINEGLGALFYNVNRPYKSLLYLEEARKKADSNELPYVTTDLLFKLGTVYSSIDSFDTAENYFVEGIRLAKKTGDIYNELVLNTSLADLYRKLERINKARALLTSSRAVAEEYGLTQITAVQNLYFGKIYEDEKHYSNAIEKYESSFNLSSKAADFNSQIEGGFLLARIYEKRNNLASAEEWYLKTINIIERISFPLVLNQDIQISHFSGFSDIYNSLIEFYLRQGRDKDAFNVLEKSRSRNTMLNLDKLKLVSSINDEDKFNEFIDVEWMISSGLYDGKSLDSLKTIHHNLLNYFENNNIDSQIADIEKHWKSVDEIQAHLGQNEDIISVFLSKDYTRLFLVTANDFSAIDINIGRDSLISLIGKVAPIYKTDIVKEDMYINQDLFSFDARASWNFYKLIFKPLLDKIPADKTIIFSFPPELLLLPVEFLVTEWKAGDSPYLYSNKNFLIEKYPVCYTPSASIYIIQKEKKTTETGQNLLVGNPHITNDEFSISYRSGLLEDDNFSTRNINLFPLEYSEVEIDNIDNIVSDNTILLSNQATESNFKKYASSSKVIHLSTHSLLYKNQPLIIFSPQESNENDGYLELGEIVQLNLNSDLVVLSSCRSGLGKIDEAEGVLGMQKAFFEAGARSIVVSLWDVSDKYTAYFMEEFYKYLSDGLDKPEALRKTKLYFMKKYSSNPYYWSAFILSGNLEALPLQKTSPLNTFNILLVALITVIFISVIYRKKQHRFIQTKT